MPCRCGTYLSYLCEYTKAGWVPIANIAPWCVGGALPLVEAHVRCFPLLAMAVSLMIASWPQSVFCYFRMQLDLRADKPHHSVNLMRCFWPQNADMRSLDSAWVVQGAHGAESPPLLPALKARSTDQFRAVASVTGARWSLWRVDSVDVQVV